LTGGIFGLKLIKEVVKKQRRAKVKSAIGYIRVSTEKQANNGVSIETQREKIGQWAELNGYVLAHIYSDKGISGKNMKNRPGLEEALQNLLSENALVTYSLSRLSRSLKDTLQIVDQIHAKGADLVSLTEKIDTTTPQGTLIFNIFAALNQFERDLTAERVRDVMALKRSRGEKTGGRIPYGFDVAEKEGENRLVKTIIPNEEENDVVEIIKRSKKQGKSFRYIAKLLNSYGIPTKYGKLWTKTQIQQILARFSSSE